MPKRGFPTGDLRLFLDFPEFRGIKILMTSSGFYNWREQCSKRIWVKELRFESTNSGYSPHILNFNFLIYFLFQRERIWKWEKSSIWVSHDTRISKFWVENNLVSAEISSNLRIFKWNSEYERKLAVLSIFFNIFNKNDVLLINTLKEKLVKSYRDYSEYNDNFQFLKIY